MEEGLLISRSAACRLPGPREGAYIAQSTRSSHTVTPQCTRPVTGRRRRSQGAAKPFPAVYLSTRRNPVGSLQVSTGAARTPTGLVKGTSLMLAWTLHAHSPTAADSVSDEQASPIPTPNRHAWPIAILPQRSHLRSVHLPFSLSLSHPNLVSLARVRTKSSGLSVSDTPVHQLQPMHPFATHTSSPIPLTSSGKLTSSCRTTP